MWEEVFLVTGAWGTVDYAEEAFNRQLKKLSADPRIRGIKAQVITDGVEQNPIYGERPKVTGYRIEVLFEPQPGKLP